MKAITTHYIDREFVESHGRDVMDVIRPTDGQVIGRVKLADEEDTRRAIAAAKRAFATYGQSTKEERAKILRRMHEATLAFERNWRTSRELLFRCPMAERCAIERILAISVVEGKPQVSPVLRHVNRMKPEPVREKPIP